MGSEAIASKPGTLRIQDVRAALREDFRTAESATVFVVGTLDSGCAATPVRLGWMRGGRGDHRALVCGACGRTANCLHVDGRGGLACKRCCRKRTRRQQETHRRDFRRLGGKEEDRLLRIAAKRVVTVGALEEAARLAEELVRGDEDRLAALLPTVQAALSRGAEP